jgi:D-xylose 1-dehydrogenase (NADP+, D-xylono-1,5-lactone-forming)
VRHVRSSFSWGSPPPGDFRLDPALGGGALLDVGCYAVSGILAAVRSPLLDVTGRVRTGPSGVDLDADGILAFAGDVEAEVHASIDGPMHQELVVRGDAGELELRPYPFTAGDGVDTEVWLSDGRGTERIPVPAADSYRLMLEEVGDAVAGGDGYVLPLRESRATAAALTALRDSAAAGGAPVAPA